MSFRTLNLFVEALKQLVLLSLPAKSKATLKTPIFENEKNRP